ncbi:MAG: DUF370 domain-containing protein [Ruminococcaceae bacterium]|nr:DUF370 domain-containing protein [Oscillospiraceae bacterium]
MYLHLGQNTVITLNEIVGIFDLDNTTVSKKTRDYLSAAEKNGNINVVSMELPKSFIVCSSPKEKNRVYLSQISTGTLLKRTQDMKY